MAQNNICGLPTLLGSLLVLSLASRESYAQGWPQWGGNPSHTGTVAAVGQKPDHVLARFEYDTLAEPIRRDSGALLVHYMAPLLDGTDAFIMSRGDSRWVSCRENLPPCGAQRWGQMEWGITRLDTSQGGMEPKWTFVSSWKPVPDNGSGWEPVFHPALAGRKLYVPGENGMMMVVDRETGDLLDCFEPFDDDDPNRFITSPVTIGADGAVYYTVVDLDGGDPWKSDVRGSYLVTADGEGMVRKVRFSELIPAPPTDACATTFAGQPLPWPPSPDAVPPSTPCGSQRPGINVAPAVAPDGTIYVVSRAHFNAAYAYLVAVNPDLTPKWAASLRDRLKDGCGVLLPPNGEFGGCREGTAPGVDPATNALPAGRVLDQSTASPVLAPDGSVLIGAATRYNRSRGHLFRFSAAGDFLGAYDFGWDITPAIYAHDDTWSVIIKDNFYPVGTYCDVLGYCGEGDAHYNLTSLDPGLRPEWTFANTNDQACARRADGSLACVPSNTPFEWCVNMIAVDRDGVVYANSEDGNLYAVDRGGREIGRVFLQRAIGAAYTPLAIADDGRIFTQNDGVLFMVGTQ